MIILKDFYNPKESYNKRKDIIENYRGRLIKEGWIDVMIEGGIVSPDHSTIFIYNRDPYCGQLLKYSENEKLYQERLKELEKDFICVPY